MVPVIELRGALPIGVGMGLHPVAALIISVIGNLVPLPFLILFTKRVFAWLRRHFPKLDCIITKLEERAEAKKETVEKYKFWGLFIFVAIPLPGTGGWTGALIAAMMDMRLKKAFPAILLGVLTAGIIVFLITYVFHISVPLIS
ncbi:MAG: small multi-drug export protein [Clostridia bacterium]|nr:small multi-drug export protein [Clostridia bacterium]